MIIKASCMEASFNSRPVKIVFECHFWGQRKPSESLKPPANQSKKCVVTHAPLGTFWKIPSVGAAHAAMPGRALRRSSSLKPKERGKPLFEKAPLGSLSITVFLSVGSGPRRLGPNIPGRAVGASLQYHASADKFHSTGARPHGPLHSNERAPDGPRVGGQPDGRS